MSGKGCPRAAPAAGRFLNFTHPPGGRAAHTKKMRPLVLALALTLTTPRCQATTELWGVSALASAPVTWSNDTAWPYDWQRTFLATVVTVGASRVRCCCTGARPPPRPTPHPPRPTHNPLSLSHAHCAMRARPAACAACGRHAAALAGPPWQHLAWELRAAPAPVPLHALAGPPSGATDGHGLCQHGAGRLQHARGAALAGAPAAVVGPCPGGGLQLPGAAGRQPQRLPTPADLCRGQPAGSHCRL